MLFPPQLVSPGLEPVKKNPTLCQKIYYCHPLVDDEDPDPSIRACLSYGWFGTQLDVGPSTSLTD